MFSSLPEGVSIYFFLEAPCLLLTKLTTCLSGKDRILEKNSHLTGRERHAADLPECEFFHKVNNFGLLWLAKLVFRDAPFECIHSAALFCVFQNSSWNWCQIHNLKAVELFFQIWEIKITVSYLLSFDPFLVHTVFFFFSESNNSSTFIDYHTIVLTGFWDRNSLSLKTQIPLNEPVKWYFL